MDDWEPGEAANATWKEKQYGGIDFQKCYEKIFCNRLVLFDLSIAIGNIQFGKILLEFLPQ